MISQFSIKKISPKTETPAAGETISPVKKKKFPLWLKIVLVVLTLLLLFLGAAGWYSYTIGLKIKETAGQLQAKGSELSASFQAQDFKNSLAQIGEIKTLYDRLSADYRRLSFWRPVPWAGRYYRDGEALLSGGDHLLAAGKMATEAVAPYYDLLGIEGEASESAVKKEDAPLTVEQRLIMMLDTLDKVQPQFDQITGEISQAQTLFAQVDPRRYPEEIAGFKVRESLDKGVVLVDSLAQVATEIKPIIGYLKPLLGIPEEKTYFLLFQNDAELRPSGGFMTAYAFLSVKGGKFTPLSSFDIYTLDARFAGLKPPEAITKYLPNVSVWHLRDMNLSPDFSESMKTFWENYLKTSGAKQVDGIISVDTQVLVDILSVLGQIGVSGWGNFSAENDPRCNCPNVVYELEKYADQPVSGTRAERKGIIGPLMHSILGNVMGSPRKTWPQFLDIFFDNIKGKHILFYFFDEELQGAIETLNAGGRIKEASADYFHLNDCNFGGAKSNMYIREEVVQEVEVADDGTVTKTVTVDYKNPAPASDCNLERGNLCLNALYRNWFRFYVPKGSELVEFNGSEVEIKTYEELGKTVFEGFYGFNASTSLKPEGKLRLTFKYRLPLKIQKGETYSLLVQKQPGALDHQYEVKLKNKTQQFVLDGDREIRFQL